MITPTSPSPTPTARATTVSASCLDAQVEIIVEEDAEAGTMGLALMEGAGEEEWQEMVDWAAVEAATGQGSSSGA